MGMENKQKGFHGRKNERTEYYNKWVKYWVKIDCIACSGTGYYDSFGSPICDGCNGTGKEWDKLPYEEGNTIIEDELGNIKGLIVDDVTDLVIYINKRREVIYQYKSNHPNIETGRIRKRLHFGYTGKGEELDWMFWDNKGNKFFIGQFENVINYERVDINV